jgi:hypothetical protein
MMLVKKELKEVQMKRVGEAVGGGFVRMYQCMHIDMDDYCCLL